MFYSILFFCSIFNTNSQITYLYSAKTINFFEFSWMIDIKSVRSISFDFCCLNSNGLWRTYSTFLASSQLVKSIHLHCYCTVHIYVVIHFCDSMWSFWVETNICSFLIICLYMYCRLRSSYQKMRSKIPLACLIFVSV